MQLMLILLWYRLSKLWTHACHGACIACIAIASAKCSAFRVDCLYIRHIRIARISGSSLDERQSWNPTALSSRPSSNDASNQLHSDLSSSHVFTVPHVRITPSNPPIPQPRPRSSFPATGMWRTNLMKRLWKSERRRSYKVDRSVIQFIAARSSYSWKYYQYSHSRIPSCAYHPCREPDA